MGDIDILIRDYCKTSISLSYCLQICLNNPKLITISADYHDITRLLPLAIIVIDKNCMIMITGKQNITVNCQPIPNTQLVHG